MSWFNFILALIFIFSPNLFQLIIIHSYFTLNWPFFQQEDRRKCKFAYGQSDHIYISLE